MKKNLTALILKIIGIIELLCGVLISFFIVDTEMSIAVCIASIIGGSVFLGFAEIVELLYRNSQQQDCIIKLLSGVKETGQQEPKSVLKDIEENLPTI